MPPADTAGPVIKIGPLTVDPGRHKVEIKGKEIQLTYTEFRILRLLAESPGRAFSRQQIVDQVRGESYSVTERIVDVQMVSLRKKLGPLRDWIETVRGVGYRFREA
jgi:two-component system phosphate regulon response regulator PhoB